MPHPNRLTQSGDKAVVEIENLTCRYAERIVLDAVNLTIKAGEILVIMGGSGAGKSTLLRHMLGLAKADSGSVSLLGQNISTLSTKALYSLRQKIGVAFQGGALLTSLNVADNVALPLKEHTHLDQKTISIMVKMKLEMVDLAGCEQLMPSELSGGMLKRAALARAIVMDPKLLFFDEPSSGLDPITAVELDELILRLQQAMNMSIVVISHEIQSALKIADRIIMLVDGKVAFTGSIAALQQSDNQYIQDFLKRRPRPARNDEDAYLRRLTEIQ